MHLLYIICLLSPMIRVCMFLIDICKSKVSIESNCRFRFSLGFDEHVLFIPKLQRHSLCSLILQKNYCAPSVGKCSIPIIMSKLKRLIQLDIFS